MSEKVIPKASINSDSGKDINRKGFLSWLSIGWLAFAGATGGFFTVMIRFLFPNVLFEPPQSFKIGYPDEFTKGKVDTRFKKKHAVWIVRDDNSIYALSTVCTHLGCTPNWLEAEQKYKCPCHGSGFRKSGKNFEGPAPRPLERFAISLAGDGKIIVDKTRSFKWEKGEWENVESSLKIMSISKISDKSCVSIFQNRDFEIYIFPL